MKTFWMWIITGLIFSAIIYITIYVFLSGWHWLALAFIIADCAVVYSTIETAKYLWSKRKKRNGWKEIK